MLRVEDGASKFTSSKNGGGVWGPDICIIINNNNRLFQLRIKTRKSLYGRRGRLLALVVSRVRFDCRREMLHLPRWIAGNGHFHERLDLSANLCDEVGRQAG